MRLGEGFSVGLAAIRINKMRSLLTMLGIIIGVDRILDMCRTAVNVWGDAVGARIITKLAPDD